MRRLALAACAAFPSLHADDRLLIEPLAQVGFAAEPARWDDGAARWEEFDAVVIRSTWDYFEREAEFRAWIDDLERRGIPLLNPAPIVRGNIDKSYLKTLAAAGVATVPTVWLSKGDLRPAAESLADVPWDEIVVKPSVSGGAWRTRRAGRRELMTDDRCLHEILRDSDALVQPFLPEIVARGEWSFLYFGGRFSHAVVKEAKAGDFRVQWTHGGRHERRTPSADLIRQADAVFRILPPRCLFSRIDGVEIDGRLTILEVERIEPYLYLAESDGAPARFAVAVRERLA